MCVCVSIVCVCVSVCVRGGDQSLQKTAAVYETAEVLVVSYLGVQVQFFVVLVLTIQKTAPIYYENPLVLATFSKASVSSVQKSQGGKF